MPIRHFFHFLLIASAVLLSFSANSEAIPPVLKDWQGWVKYEQEYRECPRLTGDVRVGKNHYICAWPAALKLAVTDRQATFTQRWQVLQDSLIPLPGSALNWPQAVTANNEAVTVFSENSSPYIFLKKGQYTIKGQIPWMKRPEQLKLPLVVALVDVVIDGKPQMFPKIENSQLWLGRIKTTEVKQADFVKLWVNRLIQDAHPMQMQVAIQLNIAGRAREEQLTQFDMNKLQLMSIDSGLNSRVDSEGNLLVQLKPGNYEVRLHFKLHGFPEAIEFKPSGENWPSQEIWVFQSNEQIRSVQVEGLEPIDSEQGFVGQWASLPHYVVKADDILKINERSRGMSHQYDSLSLERQMWLSFDNQNYYFLDRISGQKSKDWRVSTLPGYQLTQLSNHEEQRLITLDDQERTGAEIRTPRVAIEAGGIVEATDMHHASGWDIEFANTRVTLNIPPGRKLLNISGADNSFGDWINQWSLINLFIMLLTVALVWKFFGVIPSVIALCALVLGYHEQSMPVFLWLNLVAALALASKLTGGKTGKVFNWYKLASLSLLLLFLLPFIAEQIRFTLYPQLEMAQPMSRGDYFSDSRSFGRPPPGAVGEMQALEEAVDEEQQSIMIRERRVPKPKTSEAQKITVTGSRIQRKDLDSSYEQGAVIQAGYGVPDWQWQQAGYSWQGPVAGDESIRLTILSGAWVKVWRVALIILSLAWLMMLLKPDSRVKDLVNKIFGSVAKGTKTNSIALLLALFSSGLVLDSNQLQASEIPDDKLLGELQNRLYPKPDCAPDCVSVSQLKLSVNELKAELTLTYHNGANTAALVPQSEDWLIQSIAINGQSVQSLFRNPQGNWLKIPQGISEVKINAQLKEKSDLTINFPEKPMSVVSQIKGWELTGINGLNLINPSLQLIRKAPLVNHSSVTDVGKAEAQEKSIPGLFQLQRDFVFSSQWQLHSKVNRLAPRTGSLNTEVKLLDFEQPLDRTNNLITRDDQRIMRVSLATNAWQYDWRSSVSGQTEFTLTAVDENAFSEVWNILVYPNWHIEIEGLPAIRPTKLSETDFWEYVYYPRPGESLSFKLTKPPAAQGEPVAITQIAQSFHLSKRKTTNQVTVDYRATRAEQLLVNIGETKLKRLMHDNELQNPGETDGVVAVNLKPGEHQLALTLEAEQEVGLTQALMALNFNKAFSNLSTRVQVPDNRWLIFASGPGFGPAIIYWVELVFFMLVAFALSRLSFSPLNFWQWLVLGLGMSTYSWPAMAIVSAWLLGGEWRRRNNLAANKRSIWQNWSVLVGTVIAVILLVIAVPVGLLQAPDMGVVGNGSYGNSLNWFLDKGANLLGEVYLVTLPLWIFKGLMLVWATWLSFSLIKWLGWFWKDFSGAQLIRSKTVNTAKPVEPKTQAPIVESKEDDKPSSDSE